MYNFLCFGSLTTVFVKDLDLRIRISELPGCVCYLDISVAIEKFEA
jgi:hypothetical protein